eukprot:1639027-Rhodomonas_salina.1
MLLRLYSVLTVAKLLRLYSVLTVAMLLPGVAILSERLYVIGGFDGLERLKSTEVYDVHEDRWEECGSLVSSAISLRASYAMSGTDLGMLLPRAYYAMSGTDEY